MKNVTTFVSACVLTVLVCGTSADADIVYEIDNTHSSVIFKIKNRDISYVLGFFQKISGTISLDRPLKPERLKVDAEVDVKSVDTNDKKRDRHVTSPDFLDRAKFPTVSFKTTSVKMLESNQFELTGELTLLGVSKEITVPFQMTGIKEVQPNVHRVGGETSFTIKRSNFGMNNMIPEIADEVTIMVNLEAERKIIPAG